MFSTWSPTKRRKPVFRSTFVLKFELVYLPEMRVLIYVNALIFKIWLFMSSGRGKDEKKTCKKT